jgi:adenylyltransferase/sulfurtransferase
MNQITVQALAQLVSDQQNVFLLDVRKIEEHQAFNIGGHLIPLHELQLRLSEIARDIPIVVYCRSGYRSQIAVDLLKNEGFTEVKNLIGGMVAWQQEICV